MTQRLLSEQEIAAYHDQGFLVVESLVPEAVLADIECEVSGLLQSARQLSASDRVFDLEDSHTPAAPRVRRSVSWEPARTAFCASTATSRRAA